MKRVFGAFGERALRFAVLFLALFFVLGGLAYGQTWYPANQKTVAWDVVPIDSEGQPLPPGSIVAYQVYFKTTTNATPVYFGETNATQITMTFPTQGSYFVGVMAVQKEGAVVVSQSNIMWSDQAIACKDGQTFGIRFYKNPGDPKGMRPVAENSDMGYLGRKPPV